ncbi:MAG: BMP family ABC transporter substrate-binding protein, partial [Spirochaetaceae bacterium]|nr:BMP family ABC transporter substrate-binding protein [Spirochaetaceae bacterium]
MIKKLLIVLTAAAFMALALSCSKKDSAKGASSGGDMRVALLINGTLGDKSFHDSANNGMALIKNELGCVTRAVEVGYDDSKW